MVSSPSTMLSQSSVFKINKTSKSASPCFKSTLPHSSSATEGEKIPRPLNSFMIFRLEKQREIVESCPGANHRDISKIISKWWKELPKADKEWYMSEAEKRKMEHKAMYPDYKFCPQKRTTKPRAYRKRAGNELVARDFENKQSLSALFKGGMLSSSSSPTFSSSCSDKSSKSNENCEQTKVILSRFVRDNKPQSSKHLQFINVQPTLSDSTSSNGSSNDSIIHDEPKQIKDYTIRPISAPQVKVPEIPSNSSNASIYYPTTTSYYTVPPGAYSVPSQSTAFIHSTTTTTSLNRTEPWVDYNIFTSYYGSPNSVYSNNPYMVNENAATTTTPVPTMLHYITPHYNFYSPHYDTSCLYPYDHQNPRSVSSGASSSDSSTVSSVGEHTTSISPSLLTQPFQYLA